MLTQVRALLLLLLLHKLTLPEGLLLLPLLL